MTIFSQVWDVLKVFKGLKWIGHRPLEVRVGERENGDRKPAIGWSWVSVWFSALPNSALGIIPTASKFLLLIRFGNFFPPRILFMCWTSSARMTLLLWKKSQSFWGRFACFEQIWHLCLRSALHEIGKVKQGTRSCSPCISLSSFTRWFRKRALSIFQNLSVSPINKQTQGDI